MYRDFSPALWNDITTVIEAEIKSNPRRPVAAFDADGTLWDTDIGESFFRFQIRHGLLPDLPSDPWKYYSDWKASGDPRPAYLWLAQINQGVELSTVKKWAAESVNELSPVPVFNSQRKLIELLTKNKVEVYVVSASVKWAIEPAAHLFGVDQDHVIGVHTLVEEGRVTEIAAGPITYREGKVEALKLATGGRMPFLCSGNTFGDLGLLESATRLSLAVRAAKPGSDLWEKEQALFDEAGTRSWKMHQF
jgi:phosphoserine phosphatase